MSLFPNFLISLTWRPKIQYSILPSLENYLWQYSFKGLRETEKKQSRKILQWSQNFEQKTVTSNQNETPSFLKYIYIYI